MIVIDLSHDHVQNHHQHEPQREADGTEVGVCAV